MSRVFLHSRFFCDKKIFSRKRESRFGMTNLGKTVIAWPFKIGTPYVDIIDSYLKRIISGNKQPGKFEK